MTLNQTHRPIAEIEAELAAAKAAITTARAAEREAVVPQFTYQLERLAHFKTFGQPIWDDSIAVYKLSATCLNVAECQAVGRAERDYAEGSMKYLFNKLSGKLICTEGGGTMHISNKGFGSDDPDETYLLARTRIETFIAEHPEGGDVTWIVQENRIRRGLTAQG